MKKYLLFLFFITMFSCKKDKPEILIDAPFQKYVDRFILEAEQRGMEIDFSDTGLQMEFGVVPPEAAGVCNGRGDATSGSHVIFVRRTSWNDYSDSQRERLVFHELGHCELNRGHRNDTLASGEWHSIMRGDPLPEDVQFYTNFTGRRRTYYVNELFDQSTATPDWVNMKSSYDAVQEEQKEVVLELNDVAEFDKFVSGVFNRDFEIEMIYRITAGVSFGGFAFAGGSIETSFHTYINKGINLFLSSGQNVWGTFREFLKIVDRSQFNKITIRREGDLLYYFWNEQFIYWTDIGEITGGKIFSLAGPNVVLDIQSLKVSKVIK